MRFLHTSDWHLGRGLHGTNLQDAQAAVMDQIVDIAETEQVDAVLIAGDVYDRAVPPLESVQLLDRTLSRLADIAPVILIPGNHDSATRLGFNAALMKDTLHIRSRVEDVGQPVVLKDEHGEVAIYGFPYLNPADARHRLADAGEPLEGSHEAVIGRAMDLVRDDLAKRTARAVVVAHAFVVGSAGREKAQTSESERDISVGTVDCVGADAFRGVHYVALGHLHGRQRPSGPADGPTLHYSGSPLRYSFSEANHTKSVTIVDLDATGATTLREMELTQPRGMAQLRGTLDELLSNTENREDWVQVVFTDPTRPEDVVAKLRAHFPYCLANRHEPPDGEGAERPGVNPASMSPLDVMRAFITEMGGAEPTEAEMAALEPILAEMGESR